MKTSTVTINAKSLKKGIYRHYKGGKYEVLDLAIDSETEALMVVYKPLYGNGHTWIRPYNMFNETIQIDGHLIKRFEMINNN